MTRAERLAQRAKHLKAQLRVTEAQQRHDTKRYQEQRRRRLGRMVEAAGLAALPDQVLGNLLQVLAPLATLPDPVAVLDGLLHEEALSVNMEQR